MSKQHARELVVSVVITTSTLLAAACVATPSRLPESAAGVLALSDNPAVNLPSLARSETDMLERMSDANIMSRLCSTDSLEIEMAKVARDRSQSASIRELAGQLIADHSISLQHERLISSQSSLPIQMMPGDTSALMNFRLLDSLRTETPAPDFDRRYLMSQIRMHEHDVAQLQTLRRVARDKALRGHITLQIPTLERHLVLAQNVARQAGYLSGSLTPPSTRGTTR